MRNSPGIEKQLTAAVQAVRYEGYVAGKDFAKKFHDKTVARVEEQARSELRNLRQQLDSEPGIILPVVKAWRVVWLNGREEVVYGTCMSHSENRIMFSDARDSSTPLVVNPYCIREVRPYPESPKDGQYG